MPLLLLHHPSTGDTLPQLHLAVATRVCLGGPQDNLDQVGMSNACDNVTGPPVNKEQCKNDGWKRFNNPTFKSQGACVSYVESGK